MISFIRTAALTGIDGLEVRVEVDICRGLPGFHLVGLPNAEVRESRHRVLSALRNSGCKVPLGKITVNLAPAGVRKEGASFDLAIAMSIICAGTSLPKEEVRQKRGQALFLGELSLFGELRPVRGLLALVLAGIRRGLKLVVVPSCQVWEARLVPGVEVVGASNLRQVITWWVRGGDTCLGQGSDTLGLEDNCNRQKQALRSITSSLAGMPLLQKAALLAAAGGHSLLLTGPPGTGKTRLANLLGALQPPLPADEALEVTRIHSAAGTLCRQAMMRDRPFRVPHHTTTIAGLIGGGTIPKPGEVTLAHRGILFLDELTEFSPKVLDALREPLEQGQVQIVRGPGSRTFPAKFQLLAAMNPCRCGFLGSGIRPCRCTGRDRASYLSRLSGPFLDRFDLFVEVSRWQGDFLGGKTSPAPLPQGENWRRDPELGDLLAVRSHIQAQGHLGKRDLKKSARDYLNEVRVPLGLSLRGILRCIKVGGTLAALSGSQKISRSHLVEALEFRRQNIEMGLATDPAS